MSFAEAAQTQVNTAYIHGHTEHSDGVMTAQELFDDCIRHGYRVCGPTDHDTVESIWEFLKIADTYNRTQEGLGFPEKKILPLASIELSTADGHIIITRPFTGYDNECIEYMAWLTNLCQTPKAHAAIDVIKEATNHHNALIVIPHPHAYLLGLNLIDSIPLPTLRAIVKELQQDQPELLDSLAIEVTNASVRFQEKTTLGLIEFANAHKLTMVGGSDDHGATIRVQGFTYPVQNGFSQEQNLRAAIAKRRTIPIARFSIKDDFRDLPSLLLEAIHAFALYHLKYAPSQRDKYGNQSWPFVDKNDFATLNV